MLCLVVSLLLRFTSDAQVIAGIRANGKVLKNGDTVNVCRGGGILYQSTAQGTMATLKPALII